MDSAYEVVPVENPEGHITWAVREEVRAWPDYYRRSLVSFHVKKRDADDARDAFERLTTLSHPEGGTDADA